MPMAARSPIMAIPCIPIRATLRLYRPTARVLETSGSLSPPLSRPPHHQGVRLHLVGTTIGPDIPTWRAYLDTLIYRFVLSHVGNREEAEDLTSQVILKAVRGMNPERGSQAMRKWLYQVARTTIADFSFIFRSVRPPPAWD